MSIKSYLVRVELHNSEDATDYDNLHEVLYDHGYYRTIYLSDGHWYDLPSASYIHKADSTHSAVKNSLVSIIHNKLGFKPANKANEDEKSFSLTVAESDVQDGIFKVGYILHKAGEKSVLPPGKTL